MSSLYGAVTSGVSRSGLRIVIGAQEKMGKTTLGAGAPGVLLVPLEVGFAGVSVAKTPMVQGYDELRQFLGDTEAWCIAAGKGEAPPFPYQTLFFDSATGLERILSTEVISRDPLSQRGGKKTITLASAHGGYGKGPAMLLDEFNAVLAILDRLSQNHGIHIVMTCHVFSSKVMDPTAGEYDCWDLLLTSPKNNRTYGPRELVTQWADLIGFLYDPIFVSEGDKISKAMSQGKGRMLGLSRTPAYVAGNRFGLTGEIQIPAPPANGWNKLAEALYNQTGIDIWTR
jgi:AAA domain-containing protein